MSKQNLSESDKVQLANSILNVIPKPSASTRVKITEAIEDTFGASKPPIHKGFFEQVDKVLSWWIVIAPITLAILMWVILTLGVTQLLASGFIWLGLPLLVLLSLFLFIAGIAVANRCLNPKNKAHTS